MEEFCIAKSSRKNFVIVLTPIKLISLIDRKKMDDKVVQSAKMKVETLDTWDKDGVNLQDLRSGSDFSTRATKHTSNKTFKNP